MGGLDGLLRALPSFYAQAKAGEQAGFDRRRQQLQENEDRQREAEHAALQRMILEQRAQEEQATAPYRRRLLEAQASDATAQAEGTGRYAPRPVAPTRDPVADDFEKYRLQKEYERRNRIGDFAPRKPTGEAAAKPAIPTESERRGAALLHVLEPANARINAIEDGLSKGQIALNRGGLLGRFAQSPEAKQYDDDLRSVVANYLYVVSGATANPGEVENQIKMIRINEADDPATKATKRQRRQEMVEAVRLVAGRAAPEGVPAAPPGTTKSKADQWEELVAAGMSPAAATAKLKGTP